MSGHSTPLIGISGGIGAGKSVVCRVLEAMGYRVYDCDSRAKAIMDADVAIHDGIRRHIHPQCVSPDGVIDRRLLAEVVFSDPERLKALNSLVHSAVRADITRWHSSNDSADIPVFVESAIMVQSGLAAMVDEIWNVTAPEQVRIERVKRRSGLSEEEIRLRILSQAAELSAPNLPPIHTIINDDAHSVVAQLLTLLSHYPRP